MWLFTIVQKGLCTKKAEFRYYEWQKVRNNGIITRRRVDGSFTEDIEMDLETGSFERINVPPILESRRSTILHDFETVTVVVLMSSSSSCLVWPIANNSTSRGTIECCWKCYVSRSSHRKHMGK